LSVNSLSAKLVDEMVARSESYGVATGTIAGATVVDCGVDAAGGLEAGVMMTMICMGGLGQAHVDFKSFGGLQLSTLMVYTDHPAVATLASQFAGWRIKTEDYFAMGSGPARALAKKPKELLEVTGYTDSGESAVLVLESGKLPTPSAVLKVAESCGISPDRLRIVVAPTGSVAGMAQISGRVVETAVHRITDLGFDPKRIRSGAGYAPIAPPHPDFAEAMGRSNDAILYGGAVQLFLQAANDEEVSDLARRGVSSNSPQHGKPFKEIFKEAGKDFYKIDPSLFAPARLVLTNLGTGSTFEAGRVEEDLLRQSFGIT